jgi:hypothetical protein
VLRSIRYLAVILTCIDRFSCSQTDSVTRRWKTSKKPTNRNQSEIFWILHRQTQHFLWPLEGEGGCRVHSLSVLVLYNCFPSSSFSVCCVLIPYNPRVCAFMLPRLQLVTSYLLIQAICILSLARPSSVFLFYVLYRMFRFTAVVSLLYYATDADHLFLNGSSETPFLLLGIQHRFALKTHVQLPGMRMRLLQ